MSEFVAAIAESELGIVRPVGGESVAVVTRLNPTEIHNDYVGNVLRRSCAIGGEACKAVCRWRDSEPALYVDNEAKQCSDANLRDAITALGMRTQDVLMVAVTGDKVGFGDELEAYKEAGALTANPEGWQELPGYNAFFARSTEVPAIGSRLADCAHFEFEFKDSEGRTVIGFEHGTRPNMFGAGSYKFEIEGRPVSYTEYVLDRAIKHYGADPASFQIRLSSSIAAQHFVKRFPNEEQMERHVPGWFAAGFLRNTMCPDWRSGDPIDPGDEWHADARGLILSDIEQAMGNLGIPADRLACDDMLDPAGSQGEYSSYERRVQFGDTRDLYLTAHQSAFRQD